MFQFDIRRFALDHGKGNAIYKQHDIRPDGLDAAGPTHSEFGSDMEPVVAPVLPVDVAQIEAPGIGLDALLQSGSQGDQVIDGFVGLLEAVELDVL